MKQIFTLLTLLLTLSFSLNAQTYFEEGFDASDEIPAGWYVTDNGIGTTNNWFVFADGNSLPNAAVIPYEDVASGLAKDYLITPQIDLTGALNPALSFNTKQTYATDWGSTFTILVSTSSQTDVSTFVEVASWTEAELPLDYGIVRADLSAYANQNIYVAFLMTNDDGDNIFLDDVKISAVLDRDASLVGITTPGFAGTGNVEVSALVQNEGSSELNSFTANWQVDGGDIHSEDFTNYNLALGEDVEITFADQWAAQAGSYTLNVWLTDVNANGTDDFTDNDNASKTIGVASNSTQRMPLYEEFTSSTCGPCATFNSTKFTVDYIESHEEEMTLIKYQVSWPSPGDPYNTPEVQQRRAYYNISAAPTLLIDAKEANGTSTATLGNQLEELREVPAFFEIEGAHQIDGDNINVDLRITPYLTGNYTVHVAVVEENTTGNVASNGETSFEYVMMKMLPNASGTEVSFNDGQNYTISMSADLSSTFVEEMDDLKVVVFIQSEDTQDMMQSGYAPEGTLNVNNITATDKSLNFAPNPTNGNLTIFTDNKANVTIYNVAGKQVFQTSDVANGQVINLSKLPSGVYFIQMDTENATKVDKLIIK